MTAESFSYKAGDFARFHSYQSDLLPLNGGLAKIIRPLTDDECDYCETGPMYMVQLDHNGLRCVIAAFEDELTAEG